MQTTRTHVEWENVKIAPILVHSTSKELDKDLRENQPKPLQRCNLGGKEPTTNPNLTDGNFCTPNYAH